jgi:hypothetical protein
MFWGTTPCLFQDDCPAAEPPVRCGFSRAELTEIFSNEAKGICWAPMLLSFAAYTHAVAACGGNYGQAAKDLLALKKKVCYPNPVETVCNTAECTHAGSAAELYHMCTSDLLTIEAATTYSAINGSCWLNISK